MVLTHQLTGACGTQYPQVMWNSGSSTTARIELYTISLISTGNDFAIDNIRLQAPCPPSTDEVVVYKKPFTPIPPCPTCPCPFCPPSSAQEASAGTLSIYPNPAQGIVTVALGAASGEGAKIEIRDRYGKVVRSADGDAGSGKVPVDVQGLPNGIYTVSIRTGHTVATKRVVVEQ